MQSVDALICAALRGENPPWPWDAAPSVVREFCDRATFHGVDALLHSRAKADAWPGVVIQHLRERALRLAMWELAHQQVLAETLAALAAQGLRPVIVKGTALAYGLYPDPALRTRGDTDLIVAPESKRRTEEVLLSLGYERSLAVSGEFVSYQASYTRRSPRPDTHTLDLHWKFNNSEVLSRLFTCEELHRRAQPLPALCAHALGTSPVDAMLIACTHRCTHRDNPYHVDGVAHYECDRLIWLADIDLLARSFGEAEWEDFKALAHEKGLRFVCLEGMRAAAHVFKTLFPAHVMAALARPGAPEPAAAYLGASRLRRQWMDFRALGSLSRRLRFLRETVFPPPDYMRSKYAQPAGSLLWLYLRRATGGLLRHMSGSR